LTVAAARGAALDAERRTERRLPDRDGRALARVMQRLAQPDGRGRLAFPSGVGVIAETTTYLARGRAASASIASSLILATCAPYGSSNSGGSPICAAISASGLRTALCEISRSVPNGMALSTARNGKNIAARMPREAGKTQFDSAYTGRGQAMKISA